MEVHAARSASWPPAASGDRITVGGWKRTPLRYLVAVDRFFEDLPGGGYRVALDLALCMRRAGHSVGMLCGSVDSDPPAGVQEYRGIHLVRYRIPRLANHFPLSLVQTASVMTDAVQKFLAWQRWDVVHAHMPVSGLAAFRCIGPGIRRVYTVHSPARAEAEANSGNVRRSSWLRRRIVLPALNRLERATLRRADRIHALSAFTRGMVERLHGSELGSRVEVVPSWFSGQAGPSQAEARAALHWPAGKPVVLSIRRLVPRMGLEVLLAAAERIAAEKDFTLVIGGEGALRPELERKASSGVLRGRVVFMGRISDRELDLAYRAASVFVLPTMALECFGLVLLEALGRGCPVIASRAGAIPEIMTQILPEWLFEPGDAEGLAIALRRFLSVDSGMDGARLEHFVEHTYGLPVIWPAYERLFGLR